MRKLCLFVVLLCLMCACAHAETLQDLSRDFWAWRAQEQPFGADDIPRVDRPVDMVIDWSPQAIAKYRVQLGSCSRRGLRS